MPPSPSDTRASLLLRLRDEHDMLAWDEVMSIYGPLVLRMAMRQGLQQADAEDVVQEVFSAVSTSIDKWLDQDRRSGFRKWLLGICRNASLNAINRKPKGGVGFGGSSGMEVLAQLSERNEKLESEFDDEYQRQVYQWAAGRVREEVTEVTWLAFERTHLNGISIEQAAQELGVVAGNVYVARSRVMKRLRALIKEFIDDAAAT